MNAFALANDTIFNDLNMADVALYTPVTGSPKTVRVITHLPDIYQGIGQSLVETGTARIAVRVSECPSLVAGDKFTVDAITYNVQGTPRKDGLQLTWEADCYV